jgi:iron complex transport system substrate-binding protein
MQKTRAERRARIVSLAPNATSILFGIGAERLLVGVSRWCESVAPVGRLPRVGDCWAMNLSEVARLRASLIIGSVPFRAEIVEKLLELPAAFLALNPRSLGDIEADIRLLGRVTNRQVAAGKLIAKMRREFARIARTARRATRKPRVYCEGWSNPHISSPPWVAELVEIAGGRMVVPAGKRITDREVAAAKPEVIVLAWTATGDRSDPRKAIGNPQWSSVPAVRDRRVIVIRDELLNTPGPPLMDGAAALLRAIHPEFAK